MEVWTAFLSYGVHSLQTYMIINIGKNHTFLIIMPYLTVGVGDGDGVGALVVVVGLYGDVGDREFFDVKIY